MLSTVRLWAGPMWGSAGDCSDPVVGPAMGELLVQDVGDGDTDPAAQCPRPDEEATPSTWKREIWENFQEESEGGKEGHLPLPRVGLDQISSTARWLPLSELRSVICQWVPCSQPELGK